MRKQILAAALLHDVGHGPFSHVFERAAPSPNNPPDDYPKKHEGWSEKIIREKFGEVLSNHEVDPEEVVGLISKDDRSNLLAKDFISSQIDADRMDYLLRDSYCTGTGYGEFDLDWLLHSLRVGVTQIRGSDAQIPRLCFESGKAIYAVEEYIQAREFMYTQVYVHKTTRAFEALLTNIIRLASHICDDNPESAPEPCPDAFAKFLARNPLDVDDYLLFDDFRLWSVIQDWAQLNPGNDERLTLLTQMCRGLIQRGRPYRTIVLDTPDKTTHAIELRVAHRDDLSGFRFAHDTFHDLAYKNSFYRKSIDDEEQEDRVIYLIENDTAKPAETLSEVIDAISRIPVHIERLFFDNDDTGLVAEIRARGLIS